MRRRAQRKVLRRLTLHSRNMRCAAGACTAQQEHALRRRNVHGAAGTPEAVQMICFKDREYMTGFRDMKYTRTKSAAEGDDFCNYRHNDARRRG